MNMEEMVKRFNDEHKNSIGLEVRLSESGKRFVLFKDGEESPIKWNTLKSAKKFFSNIPTSR